MATQKDNTKERKPLPKEIGSKSYNRSVLDKDYSLFSLATDLQFPYSIKTYEAMASDTTLASALNAIQTIRIRTQFKPIAQSLNSMTISGLSGS